MKHLRSRVPAAVACLAPLVEAGVLGTAEVHQAEALVRLGGSSNPDVICATALAAWAAQRGHMCLRLDEARSVVQRALLAPDDDEESAAAQEAFDRMPWPEAGAWQAALEAAGGMVRRVDGPEAPAPLDACPLVLWGARLYLQRQWVDECSIADHLRRRAQDPAEHALSPLGEGVLEALLPAVVDGQPNLQRQAAGTALQRRLSFLLGGPGTGKTYTLARILAVALSEAMGAGQGLRVALAAPTGKAAQRMRESVQQVAEQLAGRAPAEVLASMSALPASTLHRLLGPRGGSLQRFEHDASNPLPLDLVIVDETSMVSAPLMARFLEALSPATRLVLVGDPDQLESVERGSVLADLVAAAEAPHGAEAPGPLAGRAVRLLVARRFVAGSPIAGLATAVRTQSRELLLEVLGPARAGGAELSWVESGDPASEAVLASVRGEVLTLLEEARDRARRNEAQPALDRLAHLRILCAHREGPYGVAWWNRQVERWLFPAGRPLGGWYPGLPLLVTRNTPALGLSNGDTGIVVQAPEGLRGAFSVERHVKSFRPAELPDVQPTFAQTVHKSQGSEYATVVFVLPPADSPLATRELVYTGTTRARERLVLVGTHEALERAMLTRLPRMTGLEQALRRP